MPAGLPMVRLDKLFPVSYQSLAHSPQPFNEKVTAHTLATAFHRKVWQALQQIPRGQTKSYQEIARAIGQPTAARDMARACAGNPVAVAIPCHRVVRLLALERT